MTHRALIADSDPTSREVLAKNLACWGYDAVAVATGAEAWDVLQNADAPKIVLLDASLTGASALELCRRVRDLRGDDSFVLVLDASSDKSTQIDALEAGADGVIARPIHMRELRMRLAAGMRGRHLSGAPSTGSAPVTRDPSDSALAGRVVAGKYRIDRLIGNGGMGTVWKGTHLALGISVAIKFIKGEYARHDLARSRFELEARSAARLQTKYAVRVFDHGVTESGMPYIVMEYLEGPSLLELVRDRGGLSFSETVAIVAQVAHALEQLHASGTIHRDVKPDNIILVNDPDAPAGSRRRIAKIIDFGVAKVIAAPRGQEQDALLTHQGIVIGTPNYMPPEMLLGEAEPSVCADLWALAACAFTAFTGRIPFEGATFPEVVKRVCRQPLPLPSRMEPSVPAQFDAWFARACSRDPAKRFRSARELASALAEAHADAADGSLGILTPSLRSFVTAMPPAMPAARDAAVFLKPTVRPARPRSFDVEAPTLTFG